MRDRHVRMFFRVAAAVGLAGATALVGSNVSPHYAYAQPATAATSPSMEAPVAPAAPAAAPATSTPAAATAPVATDTTTPRGTLKTLFAAMQDGNSAKIHELMLASTPTELKMVDAMAHRAEAEAKFRKAAVSAFGEQNARVLVGDTQNLSTEAMAQIDSSKETIDGNRATVANVPNSGQPEQPPLALTKVDGQWRIPASEFGKGADPKEIEQQLPDMEFVAGLISTFAGDVSAGKYKTAEEAGDAIKGQMMIEMMKRQNAHQQPTTAPAGAGAEGATTAPSSTQP